MASPSPAPRGASLASPPARSRPGEALESTDDDTLRKIVRGQLLNLSLNARDDEVKFKATKELADQLGLVEETNSKLKVKYNLAGNAQGSTHQNLIIANEAVASKLIGGLAGLLGGGGEPQ